MSVESDVSSDVTEPGTTSLHLSAMIRRYRTLELAYEAEKRKHKEYTENNTSVISDMQTTIDNLKIELQSLQRKSDDMLTAADHVVDSPSTVWFTRLDSHRNARSLKKAVIESRLDADQYKRALCVMDEYNQLPAEQLAHLAHKYVQHRNIHSLHENLAAESEVEPGAWNTMTKLQSLHHQRMLRLSHSMQSLTSSRLQLAHKLMETLTDIEQQSGIFLIKPMFSLQSRCSYDEQSSQQVKRTRRYQPMHSYRSSVTGATPLPVVPANSRLTQVQISHATRPPVHTQYTSPATGTGAVISVDGQLDTGIIGTTHNIIVTQPHTVWTPSQSTADDNMHVAATDSSSYNAVPRLLDMDVNRVLVGQTHTSSYHRQSQRTCGGGAAAGKLRSYVSVSRVPADKSSNTGHMTSTSARAGHENHPAHTTSSSTSSSTTHGRNLSATPPLPPIITCQPPHDSTE